VTLVVTNATFEVGWPGNLATQNLLEAYQAYGSLPGGKLDRSTEDIGDCVHDRSVLQDLLGDDLMYMMNEVMI